MFFCRQLHVLLSMVAAAAAVLSICVDAVKMRLLWLSIICFAYKYIDIYISIYISIYIYIIEHK